MSMLQSTSRDSDFCVLLTTGPRLHRRSTDGPGRNHHAAGPGFALRVCFCERRMVSLVLPPPLGLFLSLIPRSLLSGYTRDTRERGHAHTVTQIQIQDAEIKAAADEHRDAEEGSLKDLHNWSTGGGHGGAAVMVETVKKVTLRVSRTQKHLSLRSLLALAQSSPYRCVSAQRTRRPADLKTPPVRSSVYRVALSNPTCSQLWLRPARPAWCAPAPGATGPRRIQCNPGKQAWDSPERNRLVPALDRGSQLSVAVAAVGILFPPL